MKNSRTENILGAFALAVADDLLRVSEIQAPEAGYAASALALLGHEPGMPIERLRRALGLSHPGTVRLVDRLEKLHLLTRGVQNGDRRAVALHLTPQGLSVRRRILEARQGSLHRALGSLTQGERKTFDTLIAKMLRAFLLDETHAFSMCRLCNDRLCVNCPVEAELLARAPHL
jgi:MarR family transcriptional repressor of emrRAB